MYSLSAKGLTILGSEASCLFLPSKTLTASWGNLLRTEMTICAGAQTLLVGKEKNITQGTLKPAVETQLGSRSKNVLENGWMPHNIESLEAQSQKTGKNQGRLGTIKIQ